MYDLLKPEYLWRPRQVFRRLSFEPSSKSVALPLPWNCTITASSTEAIGRAIATQGVYDLPLTEAIFRLTDEGETALDVGANLGFMSLVLAISTGQKGQVRGFEPNPDIFPKLHHNIDKWKSMKIAPIEIESIAISDRNAQGWLGFPPDYEQNCGLANVDMVRGKIPVGLRRLDSLQTGKVGVLKVDVEGHEAAVFSGAQKLLAGKQIRDILFEEQDPYPALSHRILLKHGYGIFRLTSSTWRPMLVPPDAPPRQKNVPQNFLATVDPVRAKDRFQKGGWEALSGRHPR